MDLGVCIDHLGLLHVIVGLGFKLAFFDSTTWRAAICPNRVGVIAGFTFVRYTITASG
jgi:hypothetical protein